MYTDSYFNKFVFPEDLKDAQLRSRCLCDPETKE